MHSLETIIAQNERVYEKHKAKEASIYKLVLYRIFTESNKRMDSETHEAVQRKFNGYTAYHGTGYWKGQPEPCLIVEIAAQGVHASDVLDVARDIRARNGQETVLVTRQNIDNVEFVRE